MGDASGHRQGDSMNQYGIKLTVNALPSPDETVRAEGIRLNALISAMAAGNVDN